jgi:hypothetical protein
MAFSLTRKIARSNGPHQFRMGEHLRRFPKISSTKNFHRPGQHLDLGNLESQDPVRQNPQLYQLQEEMYHPF